MDFTLIATWKMAYEGVRTAEKMLRGGGALGDALCAAVRAVEDEPAFHSVGYGGYPNCEGEVQTDAAYMDGTTFDFGGIAGARGIANPIDVARELSANRLNCLLCGDGAEKYARTHGHRFRNMLTEDARAYWEAARQNAGGDLHAYHDTVCVVGKKEADIAVAVSTSGLAMKHPGRVGDSPVIGSGFYCNSHAGGAAATGVGEDVMRGCLSCEVVRRMEGGMDAQRACQTVLEGHVRKMEAARRTLGDISLIALDADGGIGAATTLEQFSFVVAGRDRPTAIWLVQNGPDGPRVHPADEADLAAYHGD